MSSVHVHALEGAMLTSSQGASKLFSIYSSESADTHVFVISPVVVSDLSMDSLIASAASRDEKLWSRLEKSQNAWEETASAILGDGNEGAVTDSMDKSFSEIEDVLRALWILEDAPEAARKHLSELTGSFLSLILNAYFSSKGAESAVMDASDAVRSSSLPSGVVLVSGNLYSAPGSADASGKVHGDGASEYTASLIASMHNGSLTFWNSRSLLCSASRSDVPSSGVIGHLTYDEATELSFFGAPIIHPQSFLPAVQRSLPIHLRYWGEIDNEGTLVSKEKHPDGKSSVKAFSVVRRVALLNVEGSGMSGVPGFSSRLFTALRREGISVILISQASSEYSICFAVPQKEAQSAEKTVRREFAEEIGNGSIASVSTESDLAILAAVGEGMPGHIGVAGKFFSSLARAGVNIRAIAQGSSERNISAVIKSSESGKALRSLHSSFFLSAQTLSIGLFGPGNIGGTLLDQLAAESGRLRREFDLDIRIRGIATSKKMLLSESGIDLANWREEFSRKSVVYSEDVFLSHINAAYYPHAVLVDCTSSEERARQYRKYIDMGFHVITPNKKAGSGPYDYYEKLMASALSTGRKFLYETTVGAGLPVICTLKDLRETGDTVYRIEGMVSGTLAWLFSMYDGTTPFSSLVLKAKEFGFTEPDPRDDLSGMDVARKTVILARELGYRTEVSDIDVESLVPESLRGVPKDEFLSRLSEIDDHMLELYRSAEKKGMKLRYVGKVENGVCSVSLSEYPADHPFSTASGTDNVIAFTTARYNKEPLVIKGPGAGPEVTAGGVFADILRLSAYLGSRI